MISMQEKNKLPTGSGRLHPPKRVHFLFQNRYGCRGEALAGTLQTQHEECVFVNVRLIYVHEMTIFFKLLTF